ncbi:hypothetical protein BU16DRAFT_536770 [Lophium mytilinum]|uniref:Uncharacterized protein n=1 Tax=Lophium mytilinum TaxID=390894 RepID=A0A6A6R342_9PEZI|nr:hypothetical protein BU16DRAFT_536770 [Lophium mytilinum]
MSLLLALPAEIRQQIVSETISVTVGHGFHISIASTGICKTLQADANEVFRSWLPSATTRSPIVIERGSDACWADFNNLLSFLHKRAARLNRLLTWPGIEVVQINVFSQSGYRTWDYWWSVRWVDKLQRLPRSVKCVKLDLTLKEETMRALQKEDVHVRKVHWYGIVTIAQVIVKGVLDDRPDISLEVVGEIPESEVGSVAHVAHPDPVPDLVSERCYELDGLAERNYRKRFGPLEDGLLAKFVKKVTESPERREIARWAKIKGKKKKDLKETRQKMIETKASTGLGTRVAELRRLAKEGPWSSEGNATTADGAKRRKVLEKEREGLGTRVAELKKRAREATWEFEGSATIEHAVKRQRRN